MDKLLDFMANMSTAGQICLMCILALLAGISYLFSVLLEERAAAALKVKALTAAYQAAENGRKAAEAETAALNEKVDQLDANLKGYKEYVDQLQDKLVTAKAERADYREIAYDYGYRDAEYKRLYIRN